MVCFQTQKQLATLNSIRVLLKSVLIDLRARNFVHAKTSLRARHPARNCRALQNTEKLQTLSEWNVPSTESRRLLRRKVSKN